MIPTLIASVILLHRPVHAADVYANFSELSRHETEGTDYRITTIEEAVPDVLVMAIHGGSIEPGTSKIAEDLAKNNNWRLYLFEGIKPSQNKTLHITSEHFDEPQAIKMATSSRICISIHGAKSIKQTPDICIGGRNTGLAQTIAAHFKTNFPTFTIEQPCIHFPGTSAANIVNRCAEQGVQLELSQKFRTNWNNSYTGGGEKSKQASGHAALATTLQASTSFLRK